MSSIETPAGGTSTRAAVLADLLGTPSRSSRRARLAAAFAVFWLALAVRSLYAVDAAPLMYAPQQPGTRMISRYHDTALDILKGEGILYPRRPDPARTGLIARPPGYSLYLAGVYATIGESLFAAQLVQNVLTSVCCGLIVWIAGGLVSARVGAVAGVLAAVEPHMGFASNLVLPDALSALPLLLALLPLTAAPLGERRGYGAVALAGLVLGAGVWLRPNVVLVAPFLALVLVLIARERRRAIAEGALMVAAAAAVVLPITIRNYVIFRELVPVSLNGGLTVWQGVAAAGGRAYGAFERDMLVAEEEAQRYGKPEYRHWWAEPDGIWRDRDRYRRAREVIRRHPVAYGRLMLERMAGMLHYADGFAPYLLRPSEAAALPAVFAESEGASAPIARRRSDERYLAPGRALSPLRPLLRVVQAVITPTLTVLVVLGAGLLVAARARAAAVLLAIPVYYLLTESCFLLEWRVVVPMHYGLFAGAGAVLVAAGALLARGASRLRDRLSARAAQPARD